ncbi:MAG: PAS-domain containing protein, partial [Alphaproteobacteria bacterium]
MGGTSTLTAIPAAANGFTIFCFGPFVYFWLIGNTRDDTSLGLLAILLCLVVISTGRLSHRQILSVLRAERSHQELLSEFEAARREWLSLSDTADAFALFGPDRRLLLSNDRFARLMRLPDGFARRGTAMADIAAASRKTADGGSQTDWFASVVVESAADGDEEASTDDVHEYEG